MYCHWSGRETNPRLGDSRHNLGRLEKAPHELQPHHDTCRCPTAGTVLSTVWKVPCVLYSAMDRVKCCAIRNCYLAGGAVGGVVVAPMFHV